jgi:AraC family transcriptional regulator, regulatory protein of adaptative response / DNA-3-methyladenine glycosylase II
VSPVRTEILPREPFDLLASARGLADATYRLAGGVVRFAFRSGTAAVVQRRDGTLVAELAGAVEATYEELRFALALDEPRAGFLERARTDPLLGRIVAANRGRVPLRVGTVAHSMVGAVAGQLIQASEAKRIENRIVRLAACETRRDRLVPSPTAAELGRIVPARLAALGLAPRRAEALVGLLRRGDPERLRGAPSAGVVAVLSAVPGIGPWTVARIALVGLGRYDVPLIGDLGLVRLATTRLGRVATAEDTAALLRPYGEWAGLASHYLLLLPHDRISPIGALAESRRRRLVASP